MTNQAEAVQGGCQATIRHTLALQAFSLILHHVFRQGAPSVSGPPRTPPPPPSSLPLCGSVWDSAVPLLKHSLSAQITVVFLFYTVHRAARRAKSQHGLYLFILFFLNYVFFKHNFTFSRGFFAGGGGVQFKLPQCHKCIYF